MAGEIFIAKEETSQEIKSAVEAVKTAVGTPDYAGGGTDVVAMIGALASAVTTLQSDIDSVKTAIAGMGGGGVAVKTYSQTTKGSSTYTLSKPSILLLYVTDDTYVSAYVTGYIGYLLYTDSTKAYRIAFAPAGAVLNLESDKSSSGSFRYDAYATVLEIG